MFFCFSLESVIVNCRYRTIQDFVVPGVVVAALMTVLFCAPVSSESSGPYITSKVTVKTNQLEYQLGEEVIVIVINNLDIQITTFDQQASCSIIRLEQHIGDRWKEVKDCFSGAPSQQITLEPSSRTVITLPGPRAGVYQVALVFSVGETFEFGGVYVVYSPQFIVR